MASFKTSAGCASTSSIVHHIDWEPLTIGPSLAFHVGAVIRDTLYVHGGVVNKEDKIPSNKLYKFDPCSLLWSEVMGAGCPPLSHHASVVIHDRYLLLIGGWDGHCRSAAIHAFDVEKQIWIPLKHSGFSEQAGLSSHTAVLLNDGQILIVGREGSLRIQKRYGNAFILKGSIESGHFQYTEYGSCLTSRSGHTASLLGKKLYIIGGRADKLVDTFPGYNGTPAKPEIPDTIAIKLTALIAKTSPMTKPPCGRKCHIALTGPGFVLIYGGETFDGRNREPVGEFHIMTTTPTMSWYKLGISRIGRAGLVCCLVGDRLICHGGLGAKNRISCETSHLVL